MEPIRKIIVLAVLIAISFTSAFADNVIPLPKDVGSIEALIDAHKKMKNAEDLAVLQLESIDYTHSRTEKFTTAVNQTRTVLNKRMGDVNSYLSLAAQIGNVTIKIANTVERYADFTKNTYKYAQKNPLAIYCYANANLQISKEISHMQKLIAGFSAAGLNILKATMQEKFRALSQIDYLIFRINDIIGRANFICKNMTESGVKVWHVQDMIKNDMSKAISEKLIGLWNQK